MLARGTSLFAGDQSARTASHSYAYSRPPHNDRDERATVVRERPTSDRPRDCPIQQGLTDEDPDVDAVYRLTLPLPQWFDGPPALALGSGSWCPFNSQNTRWWPQAYPLLYLPSHCSFRMTVIWRSFVAQRIAWAQAWSILFHRPTVRHHRNDHDLMRDFEDELPGYLHNRKIAETLEGLSNAPGPASIPRSMHRCYEALVGLGVLPEAELALLECWLTDLDMVRPRQADAAS